jgi:hypothetical protein
MDVEIMTEIGRIVKLGEPVNPEHLPVGTVINGNVSLKAMDEWWMGRSIPASRGGLADALRSMGVHSPALLIEKCHGLSLSDQDG